MPPRQTFKKAERLTRKKIIRQVFEARDSDGRLHHYPFILVWKKAKLPTNFPAQILFVISKKKFRKAARRNQIKRLIKEVYRQNKHRIYKILEDQNHQFALVLIYTGKEKVGFREIETKLNELIERFKENIYQSN